MKESLEPSMPKPFQSNRLMPTSLAVITGSWINIPSLPFTLTSIVTFDRRAPGANSSPQFALADTPILGSAPIASSCTQPVSLLPCFSQTVALPFSWAETGFTVSNGESEVITINKVSSKAFFAPLIGDATLNLPFIGILAHLTLFERGPNSCSNIS